jgi:hypothetical protein
MTNTIKDAYYADWIVDGVRAAVYSVVHSHAYYAVADAVADPVAVYLAVDDVVYREIAKVVGQ